MPAGRFGSKSPDREPSNSFALKPAGIIVDERRHEMRFNWKLTSGSLHPNSFPNPPDFFCEFVLFLIRTNMFNNAVRKAYVKTRVRIIQITTIASHTVKCWVFRFDRIRKCICV